MVGSELNPTQGKRGGKPGDIGASSFPSASHPKPAQQALAGVFSRGFSLSFLVLCSETVRKHLLRRLSHPGAFTSWLLALQYPTSARSLVMGSCLYLFVCLFLLVFVTFYVQGIFWCVLVLYVSHWNANKLFHLFSNHSAVKREQIIFTLETMKRRQESGIGISFIDSQNTGKIHE